MDAYPHLLSVRTPDWLSARCNFKRHSIEEYYRARGILGGEGDGAVSRKSGSETVDGVRTSESGDPLLSAPLTDVADGTLYFAAGSVRSIADALELMGIPRNSRNFLAVYSQSKRPAESRYLDQLWLVSSAAGRAVLGIDDEALQCEQDLTLEEAILGFVERQVGRWTEPGRPYSRHLDGLLGGDGEFAREALGFGLHVEDSFNGLYRIWSRPWIVLK